MTDHSKRIEMTRHPTARRVHSNKESLDDAFVARAFEASTWASRNRKAVTIGTIAVAVAVIGTLWYGNYRRSMTERATTELTRVRATVQSGNNALAVADLEKYLGSFGATKPAAEARLMLAQQYLLAGQADKAIDTLEKLGGNEKTAEGAQASILLANAYETSKALDKAERTYLALGNAAPFLYMKQEALDNAARLRIEQGNPLGAAALYQKIIDMTPETAPERDVYQLRMGEAQALAGVA
ncbi:MAG: tetratricopeptide repeat protein, partial [Longimicrobiales bacterium]